MRGPKLGDFPDQGFQTGFAAFQKPEMDPVFSVGLLEFKSECSKRGGPVGVGAAMAKENHVSGLR